MRVGNGAAGQRQNDIFGEMVLALSPVFLDERFQDEQSPATLDLLARLARKALTVAGTPDAGIWEVRAEARRPQTFSSLMSWAAADRMATVLRRISRAGAAEFVAGAERVRDQILHEALERGPRSLRLHLRRNRARRGPAADGAAPLPPAGRFRGCGRTVDAIAAGLGREGWLWRYRPTTGSATRRWPSCCARSGWSRRWPSWGAPPRPGALLEHALAALTPLGLLSEDYDLRGRAMWGNFPQAYSHVGLIRAAFAASPGWSEVL